jgi:hypothetical protein
MLSRPGAGDASLLPVDHRSLLAERFTTDLRCCQQGQRLHTISNGQYCDSTVTVKATSVANTSKSGSATITVSAITMSVSLSTATVQVGAGNLVQMSAIVNNDPSNQGVSWTISPSSQAANLSIQDNFNAAYNAPTTPPASDLTVTVTATSKTDSTKSATATITVPSVTVSLMLQTAPNANC